MASLYLKPIYEYSTGYSTPSGLNLYQYSADPDIQEGWKRRQICFFAFSDRQPGVVPIYQYHAVDPWRFFYTSDSNVGDGWINDGIAFYAYTSSQPNTIPVFRHFSSDPWCYQYTTLQGKVRGYSLETIAFYVLDAESTHSAASNAVTVSSL
jgi:hypothetical protein